MDAEQPLYDRLGGREGIFKLVKSFYADIRQHAVLGPIFNAQIDDWPAHLEKITEFWSLQTGGPSRYGGGFGTAHLPLNLKQEHFQLWLSLWEFNNARLLPPREATEMNDIAHQFAGRLKRLVTGQLGFGIGINK